MNCPHCGGDITGLFQSAGGHARAAKLTKAQRSDIARKAAETRWQKTGQPVTRSGTKRKRKIG